MILRVPVHLSKTRGHHVCEGQLPHEGAVHPPFRERPVVTGSNDVAHVDHELTLLGEVRLLRERLNTKSGTFLREEVVQMIPIDQHIFAIETVGKVSIGSHNRTREPTWYGS